ncbi:MAG: HlyD family type I secretion periplasmic adaptor subunit [Myxococcota bacterium]|nr:HlyD family type I secretion periplasmic adaptor subunit [Myxococcota bacterium]
MSRDATHLDGLAATQQALEAGPQLGREIGLGALVIGLFIGGFALWSTLAPLSSAAIAPGQVVVRDNRKTVQHLEGGIIREILVSEGDVVAAREVLLRLDDTQSGASREMLQNRYDGLRAEYARLTAEREGTEAIAFPSELAARRSDTRVDDLLSGQEHILQKRREALNGRRSILEQRISQLESEIASHVAQAKSTELQLEALRQEMAGIQVLVDKGVEAKPRLLEFQREVAALEGSRESSRALAARARQEIGEARLQITQVESDRLNEVVVEQQEVRELLIETEESLRAAADVLKRRDIQAPIAGTVMNLRYFTAGGVIREGDPILDIVPAGSELVVEARVNVTDIENVREDLEATVRMTAFKQRLVPLLKGRVDHVSADALTDKAGVAYYEARIVIPPEELELLGGLELQPGMPAEVLIITGRGSLFEYVLEPLTDSFHRALREE